MDAQKCEHITRKGKGCGSVCVQTGKQSCGNRGRRQWAGIDASQQGTGGEQGAEGLAQGLQREGPTRHGTTALKFPSAQTSAQPKHLMAAVI